MDVRYWLPFQPVDATHQGNIVPISYVHYRWENMRVLIFVLCIIVPLSVTSHHSIIGDFGLDAQDNYNNPLEFEGEVIRILWGNPHPRLTIKTLTDEIVNFEAAGLGRSDRMNIPRDSIQVGDVVKVVALAPTRSRGSRYLLLNLLPREGPEILFLHTAKPRWTDESGEVLQNYHGANLTVDQKKVDESQAQANGIFRVWTKEGANITWMSDLPLTASAMATLTNFDLDNDYPLMRCVAPGMPRAVIGNSWPIEFVNNGDEIIINIEEFDLVRTIYMNPISGQVPMPTPLGYSVGRWEGNTLVVDTAKVNWPYFDDSGLPQSDSIAIMERFTLSGDENRLDYEITITDPELFSESITGTKVYKWVAGQEIRPYECVLDE
jgi:hypothetical protein